MRGVDTSSLGAGRSESRRGFLAGGKSGGGPTSSSAFSASFFSKSTLTVSWVGVWSTSLATTGSWVDGRSKKPDALGGWMLERVLRRRESLGGELGILGKGEIGGTLIEDATEL